MNKTRNGLNWREAALLAGESNRRKKQKRVIEYNQNPTLCNFCKRLLLYKKRKNKFCGHSCSASFNNLGVVRNFREKTYEKYIKEKDQRNIYSKKNCLYCEEETSNFKFCSVKCNSLYKKKLRREKIEELGSLVDYSKDKWYLIEIRGHKCERCNTERWLEELIPLDIHHKDGDSDNDKFDNVLLICPNCHRQTNNHGSKNKENGKNSKRKQYRRQRYAQGLSY